MIRGTYLMDEKLNIRNKKTTLRELCRALEIPLPEKFAAMADKPTGVAFRAKRVRKGDICVIIRSAEDFYSASINSKDLYETAIQRGASLIIMGRTAFEKFSLREEDFPVILMDDDRSSVQALVSKLRAGQKGKVVMLTGSVGKTTTKDLCETVTRDRFRTFANQKNTNTPHQVYKFLYEEYDHDYEVYIQEAGAGYRGSVRFSAEMLAPDIFILTNVYNHHFQVYKTYENLFADKSSADDVMPEDGVIITNYDDVHIREHNFRHKVVSFAVDYEDVDYRAINIRQEKAFLCFDIAERSTGTVTPVRIQILGAHNAYNALAAFALGRTLGLSHEVIREDLMKYRTTGVRQNLTSIGGVYFLMDCYNVAEESILLMLKAGQDMELAPGGRKYALVGGENKLGKDVRSRSEAFGKKVAEYPLDQYIFFGKPDMSRASLNHFGDAQDMFQGFRGVTEAPAELVLNLEELADYLRDHVKPGDLVMVKGIYYLDMPIAVDKTFGTSFSFGLSNYLETTTKHQENGFSVGVIKELQEAEIQTGPIADGKLTIPATVAGFPVFRIAPKAFAEKQELTALDLGPSVKNLGAGAFRKTGIQTLTVPGNVKVIEPEAFADCKDLKQVVIENGVTHIGEGAFAGCAALESVVIPASVGQIEADAFRDCVNLKSLQLFCDESVVDDAAFSGCPVG